MGTNYYLRHNYCSYCNRYDEVHIGKQSAGWEFGFYGWHSPSDHDLPFVADSWANWKMILSHTACQVVDEYGDIVPIKDFVHNVEKSRNCTNHYDYCVVYHPDIMHDQWKDSEGWSFSGGEFS